MGFSYPHFFLPDILYGLLSLGNERDCKLDRDRLKQTFHLWKVGTAEGQACLPKLHFALI